MRKKRVITKVTAVLLSFAVVFSMIPGVVFADTGADTATVITTAEQFAKMDAGGNSSDTKLQSISVIYKLCTVLAYSFFDRSYLCKRKLYKRSIC